MKVLTNSYKKLKRTAVNREYKNKPEGNERTLTKADNSIAIAILTRRYYIQKYRREPFHNI
jgi:hypothetical protein